MAPVVTPSGVLGESSPSGDDGIGDDGIGVDGIEDVGTVLGAPDGEDEVA